MKSRVVALGAAALLGGCGSGAAPSDPAAALDPLSARPGEVVRVDDYPLFYMRTSVDYGFDAYRRRGVGAARAGAVARGAVGSARESAWACTCFATAPSGEGPLFGRNLDWWHRASLLLHTAPPNALASLSMVDLHYLDFADGVGLEELREQRDRIAQRAPYVPFDGMNERGVAIGQMAVPSAEPPYDPGKPSLYGLALIRLVLDYATDTSHAVELMRGYNYQVSSPPLHFLIGDRSGASALVEYVGGEIRVTRSLEPFMVATNFVVFGSRAPFATGCSRYDRAHSTLLAKRGALSRAEALDLLSAVSQDITMWSAVYDLEARAVDVVPGRRYGRPYRFVMEAAR